MKKRSAYLLYILLFFWLLTVVVHYLTAIPAVVATDSILIIVTSLILGLIIFRIVKWGLNKARLLWFGLAFCSLWLFVSTEFIGYTSYDIKVDSQGIELAGDLYVPNQGCPCPGLVFVHGSGPMTRKDFGYYAKTMAKKGIASIIYDKRGTGKSQGKLYSNGYGAYAADAANVFNYMNSIGKIGEAGFIGFSEGEWVVPMAYAQAEQKADFVIIVGASALSPAQQVNEEMEIRLLNKGIDPNTIQKILALNQAVYQFQRHGKGKDSLLNELTNPKNQTLLEMANDIPMTNNELGDFEDYAWWRSVMDTDPRSLWKTMDLSKTRILFIKGGKDDRSMAERSRERLISFFKDSDRDRVHFKQFENADHMILNWPLGEGTPPPVFAKGYFSAIQDFVTNE